jgi:O-antigen ligase
MRFMTKNPITTTTVHTKKYPDWWEEYFLPIGLPLLLGLGLGVLLAILIVKEAWIFVLIVVVLVPMAILIIRYPFAAIMIWMMVMPWFPFDATYKYVHYIFPRILIPLALGVVLLSRMLRLKKYSPVQPGPVALTMVALGAMGIISVFATGNHWKLTISVHDELMVPFMAYWLTLLSNSPRQNLKRLIPLMLLIYLAQCVIGLVSWFAPQAIPSIWQSWLIGDRVAGTFKQPGAYACVLILCIVFLYHEAMDRERGPVRTFLILAVSLGIVCIFLSFTRSAWLAGILVLLALLYLYPKSTVWFLLVIVPIAVILSTGLISREFAYATERLYDEQTADSRVVLAHAGARMFYARPVLGWGFGNYDRYDWKFIERVGNSAPTRWDIERGGSHNTYLTLLAEMGAVGFFLYFFPVIWWLGLTIKALPRLPKEGFWGRRLLIIMWVPISAHLVVGQTIDMRFFPYCVTLFWINLGFIANMVQTCLQSSDLGTSKKDLHSRQG